jgi:DNA-binding response OmpR family regulator
MARILVIDDSADLAMVMRMQLERAGHEVVTAENGRRGLRRFYEERPDLVVLDVRMPELDGWQTLERLRDLSDVPVLMHTGTSPSAEQLARLRPELDGYIHKPAQGPELTTRVDELLVGHVAPELVEPHRGAGVTRRAPVAAWRERAA